MRCFRFSRPRDERETVRNYVLNQQRGHAKREPAGKSAALLDERLQSRTVTARLRPLSDVLAQEGIERIDLLKINVEKSELDVLMGIGPRDWPRIRQLVIEVDQRGNLAPIISLLDRHGFDHCVEQDPLLRNTELCYVYAIRPSERVA